MAACLAQRFPLRVPASAVAGVRVIGPRDARVALAERRVLAAEVAPSTRRDPAVQPVEDPLAGDVDDPIDREPELLEDRAGRRRRAEMVEPDDRALVADPALPAERDAGLDATRLRTPGGRTDSR